MRIDIIMTRDDGSTITIASNQQVMALPEAPDSAAKGPMGPRLWNLRPDFAAIRGASSHEVWAMSFMCAEMCMRFLPIEPSRVSLMRAAVAYNDALPVGGRGRGPQEKAYTGKPLPARPTSDDWREAAEAVRDKGGLETSLGGDCQLRQPME